MVKWKVGQKITFENKARRRVRGTIIAVSDTKLTINHGLTDKEFPIDDDSIMKGWPEL